MPKFPHDFYFIPELGSGIAVDVEKTKFTIDRLKKINVKAIKVQHLYADEIVLPQIKNVNINKKKVDLYAHFKKSETDISLLKKIKTHCEKQGLVFLSSFFGEKSFFDLKKLKAQSYKIASPESNYQRLWLLAHQTKRPIFFSVGVKKKQDIDYLFQFFKKKKIAKQKLVMLHCVTSYPTPVGEYNLNLIHTLTKEYRVRVGISDHSNNPYLVPLLGYAISKIFDKTFFIEKHYTDKKENGIDDDVALDEGELENLVEYVNQLSAWITQEKKLLKRLYENYLKREGDEFIFCLTNQINQLGLNQSGLKKNSVSSIKKILGSGEKTLSKSERNNYLTTNRSLIATEDIEKNEKITIHNCTYLRAEEKKLVGLDYTWENKLGKIEALKKIKKGHPIKINYIKINKLN